VPQNGVVTPIMLTDVYRWGTAKEVPAQRARVKGISTEQTGATRSSPGPQTIWSLFRITTAPAGLGPITADARLGCLAAKIRTSNYDSVQHQGRIAYVSVSAQNIQAATEAHAEHLLDQFRQVHATIMSMSRRATIALSAPAPTCGTPFHGPRAHALHRLYRCSRCGSDRLVRARTRWFERWLKPLITARTYHCDSCDWHGWMRRGQTPSDR
jgi:DNA-directed RNA polymerase subunit RPC12/RpoP